MLIRALLWGAALMVVDPAAAEDPQEPSFKILTFNIMWEEKGVRAGDLSLPIWNERKGLVAELIRREGADIIGLQEASPEQQADLHGLLPEFTQVHHAATNNTNPILFRTARFRRVDSGALVLNDRPELEETNIGVRSSTWVELQIPGHGPPFCIYSLHLDHRSKGLTRQISAVRLMERINQDQQVVVVTGDFNTSETSPTMMFLFGRTHLVNDVGETVPNPRPLRTAYKYLHPEDSKRVIDHVLVSPEIRLLDAGRITTGKASDHDAFWARVVLE